VRSIRNVNINEQSKTKERAIHIHIHTYICISTAGEFVYVDERIARRVCEYALAGVSCGDSSKSSAPVVATIVVVVVIAVVTPRERAGAVFQELFGFVLFGLGFVCFALGFRLLLVLALGLPGRFPVPPLLLVLFFARVAFFFGLELFGLLLFEFGLSGMAHRHCCAVQKCYLRGASKLFISGSVKA